MEGAKEVKGNIGVKVYSSSTVGVKRHYLRFMSPKIDGSMN